MIQRQKAASIQQHLEIKEIKDDVVVLKNGGLRAILMTTSLNFVLKSEEEQKAIIYRYQNFLNSLDFPVQILAISRKFNIDPYISSLEQKQAQQENELLRIQTAEYIDFIKASVKMVNIMSGSLFLVVPYSPSMISQESFITKLLGKSNKKVNNEQKQKFQELKNNLWQRVEFVTLGLQGMGLKIAPLKTEELIELFYKLYNPSAKEEPELQRAKDMRIQ